MTLQQIETYFTENKLTYPFKLNNHTIILNDKFIYGHLEVLKANSGNKTYLPYYERLVKIIEINLRTCK